ncbi:D-aminoacyl-tRNA deacylase [Wolffia australiana]
MVTVVVATTADPASIGPASALLSMPGWHLGPSLEGGGLTKEGGMVSYTNGRVRLLQHGNSIVAEDDLDRRWEEATGEIVEEVIFLSRHSALTHRPSLTVHPIGVPHLREDEVPLQGGRPGWASLPNPRIGPWIRLLKKIANDHGLIPEFEVTLEATHHGPVVNTPTMFVEIGSTEAQWGRQDAAQVIALLAWEGLGLDGGSGLGRWDRGGKVLLGLGGGHYVPRHMDIAAKDGVWVGHMLSGYSLPMEEPGKHKNGGGSGNVDGPNGGRDGVGGTWKQAIKISLAATEAAFPGGQIIAHLDNKAFKGWQRNAVTGFLVEQSVKIGKPADFF